MSEYKAKRLKAKAKRRQRAHRRVRNRVQGTTERPRLAVFKSSKHVYAQIIDDTQGRTLAQASSTDADIRGGMGDAGATVDTASQVGKSLAERAKAQGVEAVVFDRGGYIYHGKVKAVAEAAREGGLRF
jgi:large subunit ribosomal protein L18